MVVTEEEWVRESRIHEKDGGRRKVDRAGKRL